MRDGDTGNGESQEAEITESRPSFDDYIPEDGESATETARKIAALIEQSEGNGEESSESEELQTEQSAEGEQQGDTTQLETETATAKAQRERDESGKFVKQQAQQQKKADPELEPPASLKPEQKKAFMNLPEGLRREYHRMAKDSQALLTRKSQELSEATKRADGVLNTARSYIAQNGMIDEHGRPYAEDRLVTELISAHHNITKDPDRYIAQMIQNTGANPENIGAYLRGESPTGTNLQADPQFQSVLTELNSVKQMLASQQTAQVESRVAPMASEFEAVMREVDPASGQFRYPELHDEEFLERTKPIVRALRGTDSSLSWGDAMRKAHAVLTGREYSPAQQTRTIAPARSNNLERARSAAVSVRGRIAPMGSESRNLEDMDAGDIPVSATETARMIYRQLQGQ